MDWATIKCMRKRPMTPKSSLSVAKTRILLSPIKLNLPPKLSRSSQSSNSSNWPPQGWTTSIKTLVTSTALLLKTSQAMRSKASPNIPLCWYSQPCERLATIIMKWSRVTGKKMVAFVCSIRHSLTLKAKRWALLAMARLANGLGKLPKSLVWQYW